MKKTLLFLSLCCSLLITVAQSVPQGMKYQAVARNLSGNILANQKISLKINLVTQQDAATSIQYSEVHNVTTNQLGLFSLTIGEGKVEKGRFSNVPWSTSDIWMQVAIKDRADFVTISNSKLLAVPYAFHAITAERLVMDKTDVSSAAGGSGGTVSGVPAGVWSIKGNSDTNPANDKLGSTNAVDVVLVTSNVERIRIYSGGHVDVRNNLTVDKDLNIRKSVTLNTTDGTTDIKGATNLQNTLDVTGATNLKSTVNTEGITTINNTTNSNNTENGALIVKGGVGIAKNLNVAGTTGLSASLNVAGVTTSTNTTQSTSLTNGALVVAGGAGIGGNLNVGGTVSFGGESSFGGQLHVTNQTQSESTTSGALIVDGGAGIAKNLNVGGNTEITGKSLFKDSVSLNKSLTVTGSMNSSSLAISGSNTKYLATFENNDNADGDGLHILLGKSKSAYTLPATPDVIDADLKFKDLLRCDFTPSAKATLLLNIATEGAIEDLKSMAGIAVGAGNMIIDFINTNLHLPLSIGPYTTPEISLAPAIDITGPINTALKLPIKLPNIEVIPEIDYGVGSFGPISIGGQEIVPKFPALTIPAIIIPAATILPSVTVMPKIPTISIPGITPVDITSPTFWGIPDICLTEVAGSSPLNNKNEFIRFSDKDSNQVGSIRAVSLTNWASNFLSPSFFSKLRGAFLSSKVDKFHAQYHFKTEITTALSSYAKIGVEYSSGNGDYAEWLERSDKTEVITPGDIVGVVGGKITKNLAEAEQVMVVSHNPIMLGNVPAENKTYQGNNIAFMGQVPVKILGPVITGDYIVGQSNTPGYGIAKHPKDMTIEDFKNAVGRSWENDASAGIKMVNTVVGVHNNNFINLIKELKETTEKNDAGLKANDARLKAIEAKLNMTSPKKGSEKKVQSKLPKSKVIVAAQG